jgi:hypothetical protein
VSRAYTLAYTPKNGAIKKPFAITRRALFSLGKMDLSSDRKRFSYPIRFSSQSLGELGKYRIAMDQIGDLRAFLTGSFIAAHLEARNAGSALARDGEAPIVRDPAGPTSR